MKTNTVNNKTNFTGFYVPNLEGKSAFTNLVSGKVHSIGTFHNNVCLYKRNRTGKGAAFIFSDKNNKSNFFGILTGKQADEYKKINDESQKLEFFNKYFKTINIQIKKITSSIIPSNDKSSKSNGCEFIVYE